MTTEQEPDRHDGAVRAEEIDDRVVDALLRGLATSEPAARGRRVGGVLDRIRADGAPRPGGSGWTRWIIGSAASLASAAAILLAALLIQSPEAGAATVLDRAIAAAAVHGPRSFRVEIDHRTGRASEADPGVEGVLDLLLRPGRPTLVRLEVVRRGSWDDPGQPRRAMGRDERGAWVTEPNGRVRRLDEGDWERHLLGGTSPLVMDDLAGLLAALPEDHAVVVDEDAAGRPRLRATRLAERESRPPTDPRREAGAPRGSGDRRPDGPPQHRIGPPRVIEVVLDPSTSEVAELRFVWPREEGASHAMRDGDAFGTRPPGPPSPPGPPPPAEIRLQRIGSRGGDADWYDAPDS